MFCCGVFVATPEICPFDYHTICLTFRAIFELSADFSLSFHVTFCVRSSVTTHCNAFLLTAWKISQEISSEEMYGSESVHFCLAKHYSSGRNRIVSAESIIENLVSSVSLQKPHKSTILNFSWWNISLVSGYSWEDWSS